MQSMFRLPWSSEHLAPKTMEKSGLDFGTIQPMAQHFKRKRTDSAELVSLQKPPTSKRHCSELDSMPQTLAQSLHAPQMQRPSATSTTYESRAPLKSNPASLSQKPRFCSDRPETTLLSESGDVSMNEAPVLAEGTPDLSRLQQVIDTELNIQILLKHNELRLIEQELAKCQIALDQLRRCEVRPFPGDDQLCESISAGDGLALSPAPGMTRPDYPSPFGVTDGPYTRHYRQWLLHDPEFDSIPVPVLSSSEEMNAQLAARPTRNSGARKSVKSINVFTRAGDMKPALSDLPSPAHRDKSSPLVLRRSTDGQLVKLICNNCQRGNFSSIQGFLNHCRIAHKVDYKSHDLAAIDCGRILDSEEVASLPTETQNAPIPKPTPTRVASVVSTPAKSSVHPMNVIGRSMLASRPEQHMTASRKAQPVPSIKILKSSPTSWSPFKPSAQLPHLSAQFAKYKLGGDLEHAIAVAKQKVDFGTEDSGSSPDSLDPESPLSSMAGSRTIASAAQTGNLDDSGASPRPVSRKEYQHRPSPLARTPVASFLAHEHEEVPESPQDPLSNLSPQTADSNPGLVSDHEDDDHGSASEDEVPQSAQMAHSLGVRRGCGADEMDLDVAVDDDMDQHGVIIRRNSMLADEARGLRTVGSNTRPLAKEGK